MKCTQEIADEIYKRAQKSSLGVGNPNHPIDMSRYEGDSPQVLAMALVSPFHDKYDIISILSAAIEVAYEKGSFNE